ncbi:MAG: polysaccharide deacetylase family protein [Nanoarchaeota archaeon]
MKLKGTVQVDLDGFWTIANYYGLKTDSNKDIIYETAIPRFLKMFEEKGIKATFFVIGKDALIKEKKELLKNIVNDGHELANHTMNHIFGLSKLSPENKIKELEDAEQAISEISHHKIVGFKAPGYDIDREMLNILTQKGYLYDSSMLPSSIYPVTQIINGLLSNTKKIRTHGPKVSWGFAPNRPYSPQKRIWTGKSWKKGSSGLLEIPCSAMPLIRFPYHSSYAFIGGLNYFNLGHTLMKKTKTPLNYSFHAIDLADNIQTKFSPIQNLNFDRRFNLCNKIMNKITKDYDISTTAELAEDIKKRL